MRTCAVCGRPVTRGSKRCRRHAAEERWTRLNRAERKAALRRLDEARRIKWEIHRREPIDAARMSFALKRTGLSLREIERMFGYAQGTLNHDLRDGRMTIARLDQLACWFGEHYEWFLRGVA